MTLSPEEILNQVVELANANDYNEADTRHKIIDQVVHDVWGWPRANVQCEEKTHFGRLDYVLRDENGVEIIIVEAKREGVYFELPFYYSNKVSITPISRLLSDDNISSALSQAQGYCLDEGCQFGAITNGVQWIFFVAFEKGYKWINLRAYVIPSLDVLRDSYTEIYNKFNYVSLSRERVLEKVLLKKANTILPKFNPKINIKAYEYEVKNNRLANKVRPIAKNFFDSMHPDQVEFMKKCYVNPKQYSENYAGFRDIIHDRISPFFKGHDVVGFKGEDDGGKFGDALKDKVEGKRRGDVVILFGGKGAGKSTFLRKFFFHSPPDFVRRSSVVVNIDLLSVSEDKGTIKRTVWNELVDQLDRCSLLDGDRDSLLELYSDRFEVAKRQRLKGYDEGSSSYIARLNSAVTKWKNDKPYTASRLCNMWNESGREVIVILDNTDQFLDLQDYCFGLAQEISQVTGCLSIISMREERFYSSSIRGLLDAFHNHGFHLTSPDTKDVFSKRIQFVIDLIDNYPRNLNIYRKIDSEEIKNFFKIFHKGFSRSDSPLNSFMSACSHGNIRFALDVFRDYVVSGYLNVDEMISSRFIWNIQIHQVVKPVMIPSRFYYDESSSRFPNLFQLRHSERSSHFTSLRILHKLYEQYTPKSTEYVDIPVLRRSFVDVYDMNRDFEKNMHMLLEYGVIESDNRIDQFTPEVDRVKITTYGVYFYTKLVKEFVYLDLICSDCSVHSEELSNFIYGACNSEFDAYKKVNALVRMEYRMEKVERFLNYLQLEEESEREQFHSFDNGVEFVPSIISSFQEQRDGIMAGAKRSYKKSR